MASGLLLLLDDIATILDDVALLTKVAAKKTAGILGDDLALNAQQVTGVEAKRELPVVWGVAKGSLINKLILVPLALLLSAFFPSAITPLMIAGGAYLCYEGCEKLAHKFLHPKEKQKHQKELEALVANSEIDIVAAEKSKISGAIRTDFILSAEIVVITLGTVAEAPFWTQLTVLASISLLMTVGVYGLVAGIVKLDDLGLYLMKATSKRALSRLSYQTGYAIVAAMPYLMKLLSIVGTLAMFLVGGGILAHGIPAVHHQIENLQHRLQEIDGVGSLLASGSTMASNALLGLAVGSIVLLVVTLLKAAFGKTAH